MPQAFRMVGAITAIFMALLCGGCRSFGHGDESGGRVRLFNGRDLGGLYTWLVDSGRTDPRRVFSVTNGLLRISGDGLGYLGTAAAYSNYLLTVEFRWGATNTAWGDRIGRARDSGLFLHAIGPDGNSHDGRGAFRSAIECNLFEGACGDFLLIRGDAGDGSLIAPRVTVTASGTRDGEGWPRWSPGGAPMTVERWGRVNRFGKDPGWRDEFGRRDPSGIERPAGEWNRVEVECIGRRIRVRLNGVLVNQADDVHPASGAILLQCEGSEIWFRRFELRRVGPGETPGARSASF